MWWAYLGILEHAEVSIHVECEVLVSAPLVQFGSLVELPLVGKHICQKQVIVGLAPLLPLLEKLEAREMASTVTAGSSLYKGWLLLFWAKPLGLPTGAHTWLLGCHVSHLCLYWGCSTTKADFFQTTEDQTKGEPLFVQWKFHRTAFLDACPRQPQDSLDSVHWPVGNSVAFLRPPSPSPRHLGGRAVTQRNGRQGQSVGFFNQDGGHEVGLQVWLSHCF